MATFTLPPARSDERVPLPARPARSIPARRIRFTRSAGLIALLIGTAVLYLWGLSESGWANSYYSAAAQAGSQSWKAFLFGSLDASNAITVDKPPASLWLMALSARIFGLSSWSILVPQALLGVATVGMLYASVRRTSGHTAGLVAGGLLALTPVATLMFRYNNPDALLTFLLAAAAYVTLRATEKASGKWLVGAGVLIGFAFLTKMLQAFLVLPAFVLVYLVAAPASLGRRVKHLIAAFVAMIVSLGWWVALVELVPESWRPYVGGSDSNSVLDLIFGYNGLGRIFGNGGGAAPGGAGGMGGQASLTRLFDSVSGGMITWLLPAALLLGSLALVFIGRAPRTDGVRAAIMTWGGWLLVTGAVFSFMAGVYHEYYTVALAPAIAALVAIGGQVLWQRRQSWAARTGLAATGVVTAVWAYVLLERADQPYRTLQWPVLVVGLVAAAGMLVVHRLPRMLAMAVLALALVGASTGPAAYSWQTATTAHSGGIVTAGPVSGGGFGDRPDGSMGGRQNVGPGGQRPQGANQAGPGGFGVGGGSVSTQLADLLTQNADSYTWVAATNGALTAASYQLATERPVLAIGGFTGGDPSPTLEQFKSHVAEGRIHYFISGGNRIGGPGDDQGSAAQITTWVAENFTATTVDGVTVYNLSSAQ